MPRDEDKELTAVERDEARIERMMDRLKLKGKDREDYKHDHMTGLGYRARRTYVERDADDEDSGKYRVRRSRRNSRDDDDDDL